MLLQMSFEQALDFRMNIGIKVHGRFCRLIVGACQMYGLRPLYDIAIGNWAYMLQFWGSILG